MFSRLLHLLGGEAVRRRDLRLLFTATFLSFLAASITFPLRMLYAQAHGSSPDQLGFMAAAFMVGALVAQLPAGWLVDRWGRVPVFLLGLISHPLITFLYIPLNAPNELIVLRLLEGMSVAAFQPSTSAYIADVTPEEHRSEVYGALGATLNAGLLLGPLFGGIIAQHFGFVTAFAVSVGIEVLAIPLVITSVHEPRVHIEREHAAPVPWRALFSSVLLAVYASFLAVQVAFGVLGALWAIWVHDLGGSYTYIGVTFSAFALPQIFLGTGAGRIADRFGRAPFLLISGLAAGLIYAGYGLMHNLIAIAVVGVIEGIVIIFQQPIAQGLLADASPAAARGRVQGFAGFIGSIGGAIASFAALPLYHQSRPIPFIGAGVVMILGSTVAAYGAFRWRRRLVGSPGAPAEQLA